MSKTFDNWVKNTRLGRVKLSLSDYTRFEQCNEALGWLKAFFKVFKNGSLIHFEQLKKDQDPQTLFKFD